MPGNNEVAPRKQSRTNDDTQPKNAINNREEAANGGWPLALNETKTSCSETGAQPYQRKKQRDGSIEATQFASTPNHGPDA